MNYWAENWSAWVGAFLVLAIYTYLWKDNPLYRVTMQIFIGVNVGYQVVIQWRDILYPQWWIPMVDGFQALFFGGTGSPWGAMWVVAGLLGLFWYFQMSRKLMWLSRIVMGVMIGITAGVTIKSQLGTNLPQLTDSFRPLAPSIVGPQPRRLFALPASDVAPWIDSTLGFFDQAGELTCVETLGGRQLWTRPMPAQGALDRTGDQIIVPGAAGAQPLDIATGLPRRAIQATGFWYDQTSLFFGTKKIAAIAGQPIEYTDVNAHLVIAPVKNGIDAFQFPGGQLAWHIEGPQATGLSLARTALVYVEENSLVVADVTTGNAQDRFTLPGKPTGPPIVCGFSEPLEDKQYAVVPIEGKSLAAMQIATNQGFNLVGGQLLWTAHLPFQPTFGQSFEGEVLLTGTDGGGAYELPRPAKSLLWTDYLDNWVFFLTLASVMTYFFFSFRRKSVVVEKTALLGRYMLMIGFGAFFGNTVMTRMSYLVDRLMFLVDEWLQPFWHHLFK